MAQEATDVCIRPGRSCRAIIGAYVRLLLTRKQDNITVTDIIRESGYSRTAFYSHFGCKDDLLQYIAKYLGDMLMTALVKNCWAWKIGSYTYTESEKKTGLENLTAAFKTVYDCKDIYRALYKEFGIDGMELILNFMLEWQQNSFLTDMTEKPGINTRLW